MEDTHGVLKVMIDLCLVVIVLILIIMEDTHGESGHISP